MSRIRNRRVETETVDNRPHGTAHPGPGPCEFSSVKPDNEKLILGLESMQVTGLGIVFYVCTLVSFPPRLPICHLANELSIKWPGEVSEPLFLSRVPSLHGPDLNMLVESPQTHLQHAPRIRSHAFIERGRKKISITFFQSLWWHIQIVAFYPTDS